jgi:cytochrome c oxidase subunit II
MPFGITGNGRKFGIGAMVMVALAATATAALALPVDWQTGFQPPASPVMDQIESFHRELFYIITAVSIFVFILLCIVVWKFRLSVNPTPSKVHHNTLLEVAWTLIPVIILVVIAIPSFKLLYYEAEIPTPDVKIRAIGKQWFWTYEYPGADAGFSYDSLGLSDADAKAKGEPRLLGVDNILEVPVNKVVEIETTGADVIHSWTIQQFGVKMDAVPGRLNHTWFKATQTGTFYGQCSELCGARHAYMPIEVKVVTDAEYAAWLADSKKKFASLDVSTRVAAK